MRNERTPVVVFVGLSGTGKTTYLEKLIPALKSRGLRLAVLKHDAHGFEIDKPGKDSYRMKAAGADSVAICSGGKLAIVEATPTEPTIPEILDKLQPVDLVLIEGYKKSAYPKIEIHRAALGKPLLSQPEELLAVVTDEPLPVPVPQLGLDDVESCAKLLLSYLVQNNASG
jgi:molybdopterin-guanine dinucleotide biosynthesis protein B